jgi:hypothetical protein
MNGAKRKGESSRFVDYGLTEEDVELLSSLRDEGRERDTYI